MKNIKIKLNRIKRIFDSMDMDELDKLLLLSELTVNLTKDISQYTQFDNKLNKEFSLVKKAVEDSMKNVNKFYKKYSKDM